MSTNKNRIRNKIASVFVSVTTVVWLSGVSLVPVAFGQTSADLQAQIQSLLSQIAQLQAQLGSLQGGGTPSPSFVSCTFTRALFLGVSGEDVRCLQRYLNAAGFTVSTSGAGSPGNESTYYGNKSKAAAASWQAANRVSPAVGYFGSISRAKYASLAAVTPPGVTPPP